MGTNRGEGRGIPIHWIPIMPSSNGHRPCCASLPSKPSRCASTDGQPPITNIVCASWQEEKKRVGRPEDAWMMVVTGTRLARSAGVVEVVGGGRWRRANSIIVIVVV